MSDPASRPGPARLAAAGLALIAVCYGLARFAYGLFVPVLREEFGLDGATAGALASSSYLGYCVAIVLATVATARWGARSVTLAAGITAAVGTGLIAAAPGTAVLACGVVVAGSSTGLASPPLADAVTRSVVDSSADRVQTVINAGTGLGVLVSGPVALLTTYDWRAAWALFALLAVAVTVWAGATVPRMPPAAGPGGPRPGVRGLLPPAWAPAGAPRLFAAAGAMGLGSSAVWTFGRDVAVGSGALSPSASTLMWIVLGAAGLLGAFTGTLTAATGIGRAWAVAMPLLGAATLGPALGVPWLAFAAAALFGAVYIGLTGLLLLWGTRIYAGHPSFGVGAAFLLLAVGQSIGSPLVGTLSDLTTPGTAFGAAACCLALGALLRPRSGGRTRS